MKTITWTIRIFFLLLFVAITTYIVSIETEKYESTAITTLQDLSEKQEVSLGSILTGQGSENVKDSKILELYISSFEMYDHLDAKFHLSEYYVSTAIDAYQRLYKDAFLPAFRANRENLLAAYNKDLFIIFDNVSQTITLKFAHADKNVSQHILEEIINFSDQTINTFSRENAKISLRFIEKQVKENREIFISWIKKMTVYQTQHRTIDPQMDVERKNIILSELEVELAKKEVEYSSKIKVNWNKNGYQMRTLKSEILNLKKSIKSINQQLSGNRKDAPELNVNVFDFQILKNEMEFAKEVYKETLINQEKLKIEVNQNAKHLVVVAKPTKPDSYTYPDKVWDIFTLILTLLFLYSILMTAVTILKDHKD
ncbi:MAG TPA: hypothetical protein EYH57_07695 [Sulfurovum sp.]|nr:hypothetical protein [Sulfurovum sp.]